MLIVFCILSVTGRSRSDVSQGTDRDFTDVPLVSEDTYKRPDWRWNDKRCEKRYLVIKVI